MNLIEKFIDTTITVLESTLKLGFEMLEIGFTGIAKKKEGYSASFISQGELLSSRQYGFCLSGDKNLSVKNSYQNAFVVAATGLGKTSTILLPSLYTMKNSSFIVHDPSGENFLKASGYLKEKGYLIKQLNFSNPHASSGFNPLQRANTSSEIQKVSSMLIENSLGKNGKDAFWTNSAVSLLSMLVSILKKQDVKYQNLYNVRMLLNTMGGNPKQVDNLFSKDADENLFLEYKSFLSADEKITSGVIASCKAALQLFSDEAVAKVTSTDTIDMQEFRNRPTVLFIQNPVAESKYFSTLSSILFEQFFAFILSRFPKENEHDIFFLIDEASSLNMPTLQLALSNIRKTRAGILLLYQSYDQCINQYGKHEAESIRSNCFAKLFFTAQSLDTSRELEQLMGKFEYKDKEGRKVTRELMTRDEIRTMKLSRALLVCGHHSPILARLKPYYQSRIFRLYSELKPPVLPDYLPDTLPVLKLNDN